MYLLPIPPITNCCIITPFLAPRAPFWYLSPGPFRYGNQHDVHNTYHLQPGDILLYPIMVLIWRQLNICFTKHLAHRLHKICFALCIIVFKNLSRVTALSAYLEYPQLTVVRYRVVPFNVCSGVRHKCKVVVSSIATTELSAFHNTHDRERRDRLSL